MRRCRIESLGVSPPRRRLLALGLPPARGRGRRALPRGLALPARRRPRPRQRRASTATATSASRPSPATSSTRSASTSTSTAGGRSPSTSSTAASGCSTPRTSSRRRCSRERSRSGWSSRARSTPTAGPTRTSTFAASGAAMLLDLSPRNGDGFGAFVFDTREEHADLYTAVVSLKEPRGRLLLRRRAELEDAYLAGAAAAVAEALVAGRPPPRGRRPRRPGADLPVVPQAPSRRRSASRRRRSPTSPPRSPTR